MENMDNYVWSDRKRIIFGLPWSCTRYYLNKDKLIIDSGFLNRTEEEIRLYRIVDVSLKRSLGQRFWGLGRVHLCTADKTSPEIDIRRVKRSRKVKEMLSDMVEAARDEKNITIREFINTSDDDHDRL